MEVKLIIAGSRTFCWPAHELLMWTTLDNWLQGYSPIAVFSGTARGADVMGERWAAAHGVAIQRFPANWDKHGKSAGYKRNMLMADNASHALVFWDGESKGAKHMIDIAEHKEGVSVKVMRF